jgi:hypothetical protein
VLLPAAGITTARNERDPAPPELRAFLDANFERIDAGAFVLWVIDDA